MRVSTADITTLPLMGSNIIFQETVYSENSPVLVLGKASHLTLSGSWINSRSGNWK
jgi:hypothetical protein